MIGVPPLSVPSDQVNLITVSVVTRGSFVKDTGESGTV
jgi:hypothetical protein